ncbi:MAG TPA: hypothetical protein VK877_01025 [Pseudolabrys sp.]|nr:hypothetical protein [Pseudolabrys sp.]
MVPDDWLSDAENSTAWAFGRSLCGASIRLRDATDQFSTIREYMPYFQGNHAFPAVVVLEKRAMLHCNTEANSKAVC